MDASQLNLARKWRSKNFDHMIGQTLPIRMLKNSLYRSYFFPVYLFAGYKGCGKTTAARIFAAAINCQLLPEFQKNAQCVVPCGTCHSCMLVFSGSHPDFIEIDAASHTGVDHVRMLIDGAALLPTIGNKKIYLVDEAHMLSKASFNAFLKILEEPPRSVLFIFATTDPQKIIETVRSRCFQIFFGPIERDVLRLHLENVCKAELIPYEGTALSLVAAHTGGCVRDALNLIEQVRFALESVTNDTVQTILGQLPQEQLCILFDIVHKKKSKQLFPFLTQHLTKNVSIETVWAQCLDLIRTLILINNDAYVFDDTAGAANQRLISLAKQCGNVWLCHCLQALLTYQELSSRLTDQRLVFELLLLKLCDYKLTNNDTGHNGAPPAQAAAQAQEPAAQESDDEYEDQEEDDDIEDDQDAAKTSVVEVHSSAVAPERVSIQKNETVLVNDRWTCILSAIMAANDPLVQSLFEQVKKHEFDENSQVLHIFFAKENDFFSVLLDQTKSVWQSIVRGQFGQKVTVATHFTESTNQIVSNQVAPVKQQIPVLQDAVVQSAVKPVFVESIVFAKSVQIMPSERQEKSSERITYVPFSHKAKTVQARVNIKAIETELNNTQKWPKVALVRRYFPSVAQDIMRAS